ncbi:30S ribosomal protein S6 [Patescibacteria group bacterium]|nr:30S ribosomal protein S6 [Patescibacteria group bacterium]
MLKDTNNNLEAKKVYEISFLLKDPSSEKIIVDLLNQHEVLIKNKSSINSIKLAYPIKKYLSAYFGYINFEADPASIKSFSDSLKFKEEVLRYLIITVPITKVLQKKDEEKKVVKEPDASRSALTNEALEEKLKEILE